MAFPSVDSDREQEHRIPDWAYAISPARVGISAVILGVLFTLARYLLQATLNYPALLVDKPSLAAARFTQGEVAALLGFAGLLVCGVLLVGVSLGVGAQSADNERGWVANMGLAAGAAWAISGLLGVVLALISTGPNGGAVQLLTTLILLLAEMAAPLLLAVWTVIMARQLRSHMVLGMLGAIGLFLVFLRSLVWMVNGFLPIESGYYGTAGMLALLALLGESIWLVWLFLFGLGLMRNNNPRNALVRLAARVVLVLVLTVFAFIRFAFTIVAIPSPQGSDVPSEPSYFGSIAYSGVMVYLHLNPMQTVQQELANQTTPFGQMALPSGVSLENANANGVPSQVVCAPGAVKSRFVLYIHGGGFAVPLQDADRVWATRLSQATGACALVPEYRLIPAHPFPAGLDDSVAAYHWLRAQGVDASKIVILGGSAGANLTLATALKLRDGGEAMPAGLVAMSPPTDLTLSGETFQTKANVDPILGQGLVANTVPVYTNNGATDVRDPLVSPLYADARGLPPMLLQVGTQEVLLSDSVRFAERAQTAGDNVTLEVWPGMFHGWQNASASLPESRFAFQHIAEFVAQRLGR